MEQQFSPTYLYVKQHTITGKLYFGKTTRSNPELYVGSGKYWKRHIQQHGKQHVVTLWSCLFSDQHECMDFALAFSELFDIVESNNWLNLVEETGIGGNPPGYVPSIEARAKMSASRIGKEPANKGVPHSDETRQKMSESSPWKGKSLPAESVAKRSQSRRGIPRPKVECPHCGKVGGAGAMQVWHFDNCKMRGA